LFQAFGIAIDVRFAAAAVDTCCDLGLALKTMIPNVDNTMLEVAVKDRTVKRLSMRYLYLMERQASLARSFKYAKERLQAIQRTSLLQSVTSV